MLVLSRKVGEEIVVGDDVRIRLLAIHGNQVRLGISAPVNVPIHRSEVYCRIQSESQPTERAGAAEGEGRTSQESPDSNADDDLGRRLRSALHQQGISNTESLAVEVYSGKVTISGRLPSTRAKALCVECCRHIAGVRQLIDMLDK